MKPSSLCGEGSARSKTCRIPGGAKEPARPQEKASRLCTDACSLMFKCWIRRPRAALTKHPSADEPVWELEMNVLGKGRERPALGTNEHHFAPPSQIIETLRSEPHKRSRSRGMRRGGGKKQHWEEGVWFPLRILPVLTSTGRLLPSIPRTHKDTQPAPCDNQRSNRTASCPL